MVLPYFNSYFGEKSKTNNLIILSYQKIICTPLLTTSGVAIMEQMEQLLPGTPRAICAIRTNPIFLEEEAGSLGADWYIHIVV